MHAHDQEQDDRDDAQGGSRARPVDLRVDGGRFQRRVAFEEPIDQVEERVDDPAEEWVDEVHDPVGDSRDEDFQADEGRVEAVFDLGAGADEERCEEARKEQLNCYSVRLWSKSKTPTSWAPYQRTRR